MRWFAGICTLFLCAPLPAQQGGPSASAPDRRADDSIGIYLPPVLRNAETSDNLVVTLPGAPDPKPVAVPAPDTARETPPTPKSAPQSADDHRPLLRRAPKPILPAEFERDSGFFCQKLIGAWTERDAYNLFGDALRQRSAFDDDHAVNGRIYAYSDPTGRYREIELDFAKDTGLLRTVFVYPWKMSWEECRHQWGSNVQAAEANRGRKFYSYVNRRLDVLVDPSGNVISLGLY